VEGVWSGVGVGKTHYFCIGNFPKEGIFQHFLGPFHYSLGLDEFSILQVGGRVVLRNLPFFKKGFSGGGGETQKNFFPI